MKLARVGVIAAAVLAVATLAWAQKPDFSGTWTLDPASAPAGGAGRGGSALGNGPATVKQTADALTIERAMGDTKATLTYKLDGTESRNMMLGRGGTRTLREHAGRSERIAAPLRMPLPVLLTTSVA